MGGLFSVSSRICEFWQPSQRSGRHPGHERFSNRHEKTESTAQKAQRCQPPILSDNWEKEEEIKRWGGGQEVMSDTTSREVGCFMLGEQVDDISLVRKNVEKVT